MKRSCSILLTLALPVMGFAEPPDTLWSRTFGGDESDWCVLAEQTPDSGYVFAGATSSFGAGGYDFWLIKTDANGDSLWSRTYGGTAHDQCSSAQQTSDGGFILVGHSRSYGAGGYDYNFWLVKTDADGNQLWSHSYGGDHWERNPSVQQTFDGGYIISGTTSSYGAGATDCWLVKTNASGDTLWTRTHGFVHDDYCAPVRQTADSGYILAWNGDYSDAGVWLAKLDANGDSLWRRKIADSVFCVIIEQSLDGGYFLAGDSSTWGCEDYDFWLMKTDTDGRRQWSRVLYGYYPDPCHDAIQTSDRGYVLVGQTEYCDARYRDFRVVRTDPNGIELWNLTFGGNSLDECFSVHETFDGGLILGGDTWSFGAGASDVWVVRMEGECPDWTPATTEVVISVEGNDARLTWRPVTESVAGCPIAIDEYRVYSSVALEGHFTRLATVEGSDTTWVHTDAFLQDSVRFYYVCSDVTLRR